MPKSAVETVTGVESYFVSFEKNSPGRTSANDVAPSDSQNKKPNKTEKEKKMEVWAWEINDGPDKLSY